MSVSKFYSGDSLIPDAILCFCSSIGRAAVYEAEGCRFDSYQECHFIRLYSVVVSTVDCLSTIPSSNLGRGANLSLAQLVEHPPDKREVAGSSPVGKTILITRG